MNATWILIICAILALAFVQFCSEKEIIPAPWLAFLLFAIFACALIKKIGDEVAEKLQQSATFTGPARIEPNNPNPNPNPNRDINDRLDKLTTTIENCHSRTACVNTPLPVPTTRSIGTQLGSTTDHRCTQTSKTMKDLVIESLDHRLGEFKDRAEKAEARAEEAEAETRSSDADNVEVQIELDDAKLAIIRLEGELTACQKEVQRRIDMITGEHSGLETALEEIIHLEGVVRDLQANQRPSVEQNTAGTQTHKTEDVEKIKIALNESRDQTSAKDATIKQLEQTVRELTAAQNEESKNLEAARKDFTDFQDSGKEKDVQIKQLEEEVRVLRADQVKSEVLDTAKKELDECLKRGKGKDDEIKGLQDDHQEEKDSWKLEFEGLKAQLKDGKAKIEEKDKEIKDFEVDKKIWVKGVDDRNAWAKNAKAEKKEFENALKAANADKVELEKTLDAANAEKDKIQEALKEANTQVQSEKQNVRQAHGRIPKFIREAKVAQSKIEALEADLKTAKENAGVAKNAAPAVTSEDSEIGTLNS